MNHRLRPTVQKRIVALFLAGTALILIMWLRLGYVQLVKHAFFEEEALKQRFRTELLVPVRGTIFDRNGVPLAMTEYGFGVYATPRAVHDAAKTASVLAPLLERDEEDLLEDLNRATSFVWLKGRLATEVARTVDELGLPGVYVVRRPQRGYPHGSLAADVLGFTGRDNQGLGGLEFRYDELLKGIEGRVFSEKDPWGRAIAGGRSDTQQARRGHDLFLTIDHVLQYVTEQELAQGIENAKAEWGLALLMEPATGAVLASAVLPAFDPADYGTFLPRPFRNPAVTDQFEPGSTLKIFTAAAALEEGLIGLDTLLEGPALLHIGGGTVRCHNGIDHGTVSLKDALAVSCNTAFAHLGANIVGGTTLARYMRAFGFGNRLGIDLPGEAAGTVPTPGRVEGELLRWANVSFGHGIAVTPIQLAAATAAIANGGDLMQPYVVQQIVDDTAEVVFEHTPTVLRRVISPTTARDVAAAMESVVRHGTGRLARLEGYRVAGKTGTAQVPEHGVYGDKRLSSFVGFAPADDPALVLIIMLYDVQQDAAEGGRWAAPVFANIMQRSLQYIGIPPRL